MLDYFHLYFKAMSAFATAKSTHISVIVPMIGYGLCSIFCFYVLFEERIYKKSVNDILLGEHMDVKGVNCESRADVLPDNDKESQNIQSISKESE